MRNILNLCLYFISAEFCKSCVACIVDTKTGRKEQLNGPSIILIAVQSLVNLQLLSPEGGQGDGGQ